MPPRLCITSVPSTRRTHALPIAARTAITRSHDRNFSHSSRLCERKPRRKPQPLEPHSRERDLFIAWKHEQGLKFRDSTGSPNYVERRKPKKKDEATEEAAVSLEGSEATEGVETDAKSDRKSKRTQHLSPFPLNPYFKSMPVLSENLKEEIYQRVAKQGQTVRTTSQHFHISMERVAAVVRMKQMERDRLAKREPIIPFYTEKIMEMLPQTHYQKDKPIERHESINDLPVHPATTQQIWWPTSESREFTRIDAGEVFKSKLLPADLRMPHPQTVEKWADELQIRRSDALVRMQTELEDKMSKRAEEKARAKAENNSVVQGQRFDYKFEKVNADWAGKDGRNRKGVGWRYGMPFDDRKRGLIKIPTKVE